MRCSSCDHDNRAERRFCAECGAALTVLCASCGAANEPSEKFCGGCGERLPSSPSLSRVAAATPQPESAFPAGERRQLTILFCDLVGSTALAARLDPEEWRDIAAQYHRSASEAITRFDGHVAQLLGDGVFAYFGWPQAHEDDAERGIRAGLALLETIAALNALVPVGDLRNAKALLDELS